jgi:fructose-bisphosphate aldolase, class I
MVLHATVPPEKESSGEDLSELVSQARALVARGKGILAADESFPTIEKRFRNVGVMSTWESRREYRELLLSTPGLEKFISGVILFDETMRQKTSDGVPFPQLLHQKGIRPGIKVDLGAKPLANFSSEKVTEGLDGLRERLAEYRELGATFTKWRAVFRMNDGIPTLTCVKSNVHALARFAAMSQEARLVPIVEPEVLRDGAYSIERCSEITEVVLKYLFASLFEHRVHLEGVLLKVNMILPGKESPRSASVAEVAEETLKCLQRVVPPAVPGIVFLSGGQDEVSATQHLNAMNQLEDSPWELSFSFGRALQESVLKTWKGDPSKWDPAQDVLLHRARLNSLARYGRYRDHLEKQQVRPRATNRLRKRLQAFVSRPF